MITSPSSLLRAGAVLVLALSLCPLLTGQTPKKRKNPTSKLFVADVDGQAQINTGDHIEDVTKKHVYDAQGTLIQTKVDATNTMVFSNGTGIFLGPETLLEVKRFQQEPFTPNRTDLEMEPSISQTSAFISRGAVGFCTSKPVAGSNMVYHTPHATVAMRGSKVFIEVTDSGTKISLLGGDVTVRGGEFDMGGQSLRPGQQALVAPSAGPGSAMAITIRDIPAGEAGAVDQKVTMACMARSTVYFDTASRRQNDPDYPEAGEEIVAIPVAPAKPPIQHTVSASRIAEPGN